MRNEKVLGVFHGGFLKNFVEGKTFINFSSGAF